MLNEQVRVHEQRDEKGSRGWNPAEELGELLSPVSFIDRHVLAAATTTLHVEVYDTQ